MIDGENFFLGALVGLCVGAAFDSSMKPAWRIVLLDCLVGATSAILANWAITSQWAPGTYGNRTVLEPRIADGVFQLISSHTTIASLVGAAAICTLWRIFKLALRRWGTRRGSRVAPAGVETRIGPSAELSAASHEERNFKVIGNLVILVGVTSLIVGSLFGFHQWRIVSRWPRADATLIAKQVSGIQSSLLFRYEAGGRSVLGAWRRWGSPKKLEASLATHALGAWEVISYNPENPSEAQGNVGYNLELFGAPLWIAGTGALLVAGGLLVRRKSLWQS